MSQPTRQDLERNDLDGPRRGHTQSTSNQQLQGESNFGDSSGPLFSIYSKAAEEEDNKMVERWQKDADGILIFTGLFSAAVAALLAVTVQDLRPNSQDTSAFYLGNIYQVLADPNVTRSSIPSPPKPPPFSRPRYAVWVNSLWFLSLVMSLSCALWATLLHQWARRYIRLTQPARCSPEKRARMHAFFAEGVENMHIPWGVEGLPTLLHISLFLFFGGLAIFLFNVDQGVFMFVVWWIGLFTIVYGLITLLPLIRYNSPYYAPLSFPTWFLYAGIRHLAFKILNFINPVSDDDYNALVHHLHLRVRYRGWMLGGVEQAAEDVASERSSEIDERIFGWTISALGDDDSLEKFFEAIPGFFNSELVKHFGRHFPERRLKTFWGALNGFMGRSLSSNLVTESVKSRRDIICRDVMNMIPCPYHGVQVDLRSHFDQASVSMEGLQAMAQWFTHLSQDVSETARIKVAVNLPKVQERDDRWIGLASDVYGLPELQLQHKVSLGGDTVLLAILIHVSRQVFQSFKPEILEIVLALAEFDIRHTRPGLQHEFCTLWNDLVREARYRGFFSTPVQILVNIRRLYITLHQGTGAALTAFSASTDDLNILFHAWSYPFCNIASHRPDSIAHVPVPLLTQPDHSLDASPHHSSSRGSIVSQQVTDASNIAGPPSPSDPTTPSELGDSSQDHAATPPALPIHTSPNPTDAAAAALQDIPLVATNFSGTLSHASTLAPTPTVVPVPAVDTLILHKSLASCGSGAASFSKLLLPASPVVSFSISASPPPSPVPLLPNADSLLPPSSTTLSRQTSNITLPRLRARGLVNTGNMCFANAVLQLLVRSPPLWNLLMELGDSKGQSGAGGPDTGNGATPLIDATVKFCNEFLYKEELSVTKQLQQEATRGKPRENEDGKKEHSFNPRYMYDAMKEKRRLKDLFDGQQQDAEEIFHLYLNALDEELQLLASLASISGQKSATATPRIKPREASGQADVGGFTVESVESPLMCIFGGKFCSTLHAPNRSDTVTIEDWRSLQIDIQHDSVFSIEDALARISHLQPVQLGPSGSSEASQQVLIEVLPSVLVLHLKRFLYDVTVDGIVKISKTVQFAPELEIPLEIMAPASGESALPVHYKLYGVLSHHGESAGSGHYTVDVLHPNGDSGSGEAWLHIDDEAVKAVRHEDVFGVHSNEQVDDRCAYMLFYCRTGSTRT